MFEKSLTDLIRGIRANKKNEEKYIATCLDEIRNEVRKNDPEIKAGAIRKLVYLHMHGYDMAWASFHVIEVMSSPKIQYKRLGYQAASVSFKQDTDVLMLCTNLIKKDLSSNSYHESALALHGLASIVTPDLGRDLAPDLIAMMNHSRPYIRKRVILVLYRVFLKYPEALRLAFPRLKEKLDDPDPAVVSAAVNVICELARRNPKSYLNLAPSLYGLLTNSTNNWMLIKIIKLFAALTPLEPRLVKKLRPQITNLIQSTSAMSLLYECIHTVIVGGMIGPETEGGEEEAQDQALARLLTSKLKLFIEEPDQNLKYLGLYALWKLLAVRPKAVIEHRDTILACLDDADVSIRMRALDIVTGMVTQSNLMQIVRKLMGQVLTVPKHQQQRSPPAASFPPPSLAPSILDASDRTRVLTRIIDICSKDTYANITDFEWYLTTLVDMVRLTRGVDVGNAVAQQLVNVTVRVPEVREFAVAAMRDLLMDDTLLLSATQLEKNNAAVLWAAAWICGEFRGHVDDPSGLITRLLARGVVALPPVVQAVFLQNALKLYAHWAVDLQKTPEDSPATTPLNAETFGQTTSELLTALAPFRTAADLEVQERACEVFEIIQLVHRHCTHTPGDSTQQQRGLVLTELHTLFKGELNPVASKAQKRVPVPEGLDLDAWIFEPEPEPVEESSNVEDVDDTDFWGEKPSGGGGGGTFDSNTDSPADADRKRAERRERQKFDPYYIPSGGQQQQQQQPLYDDIDVNEIPIVRLDLPPLSFGEIETGRSKKSKKGKSTRADDLLGPPSSSSSRQPQKSYNINRGGEMPDGPAAGDDDRESPLNADVDEITKAVMSVDLTAGADGEFDVMEPRDFPPPPPAPDKNTTGELLVVRKKVGGVKKGVGEEGGGGVKMKKKKKEKGGDADSGLVKKKKKKTVNEEDVGVEPVKKIKKKKAPVTIADPAPTSTSTPATPTAASGPSSPAHINKSQLYAGRGIDIDAPYERVASPALSVGDTATGADHLPTPTQPEPEEPRDWIDIGGDDTIAVSYDWERADTESTTAPLPIHVHLRFTNTSPHPITLPNLTLSSDSGAVTAPLGDIHLPRTPTQAHTTTLTIHLPRAHDPPYLATPQTLHLTCGLARAGWAATLVLPSTTNFLPASSVITPPSPEEFATILANASLQQAQVHTSTTQFHIAKLRPGWGADEILARVGRRVRMGVVEGVDGAATFWGWVDAGRRTVQGDSETEPTRPWCAALIRVTRGQRGMWIVRAELKAVVGRGREGLEMVEGVVAEIGEWCAAVGGM